MESLKLASIRDLYDSLANELAYLMTLFNTDRELFVNEIITRSDNEVSLLNILEFNPLTPDTYIYHQNEKRLFFILTKERYFRRWGERRNERYLVIGVNDNFTVYSYLIWGDVDRRLREILRGSLDIWQFDNDEHGRVIIPYGIWIRIQGDLIVQRHNSNGFIPESENLFSLYGDLTNNDIDNIINKFSNKVKFTKDMIKSIKIRYRLNKNISFSITKYKYGVVYDYSQEFKSEGDTRKWYRVNLSWIGGANHTIEYYGYKPKIVDPMRSVFIQVLSDSVNIYHNSHIPISLKVNPGDVLEFSMIEQAHDGIEIPNNDGNIDMNFIIANMIYNSFRRYANMNSYYWNLYKYGVEYTVNKIFARAMNSIFKYVMNRIDKEKIINELKQYANLDRQNVLRELSDLIGEDNVYSKYGELLLYIKFKVYDFYRSFSYGYLKSDFDRCKDDYYIKIIFNDYSELDKEADIYDHYRDIMNAITKYSFKWYAIALKGKWVKNNKYSIYYICISRDNETMNDNDICIRV